MNVVVEIMTHCAKSQNTWFQT